MIIILGLVILVAAVVAGVAGVLGNAGSGHPLTHPFTVLGYHVTGSTGTLFLYGIVTGALGLFGLSLLLAGARRTSRRGSAARGALRQSRRETAAVSRDRDDLLSQREAARADTATAPDNGSHNGASQSSPDNRRSWQRLLGQRTTPSRQPAGQPAQIPTTSAGADVPAQDVPADASAAAE